MNVLDFTNINKEYANQMVEMLNDLLANKNVYYSNLRAYHWHVVGPRFFELHSELESQYTNEAEQIDEVAERIMMLDGSPLRYYKDIEAKAELKQANEVSCADTIVNDILATLKIFMAKERAILAFASDNNDDVTVDLMNGYLVAQEKLVWMLLATKK